MMTQRWCYYSVIQTVTFQVDRKCKKNHLCEIPFTMLKIYEVNICYMDLYLILLIIILNL